MFEIGDFVEIRPKTIVDRMLKDMGTPNTGIIVGFDVKTNEIIIYRDETMSEMNATLFNTRVREEDLTLINGNLNTEGRKKQLKAHADWFKKNYPGEYVPQANEIVQAVVYKSGDELTLDEAEYIVNLLKE